MQLYDLYNNLLDLGIDIRVYKTAKNLILEKRLIYLNQVFEDIVTTNRFSILFYNYKYKELTNY